MVLLFGKGFKTFILLLTTHLTKVFLQITLLRLHVKSFAIAILFFPSHWSCWMFHLFFLIHIFHFDHYIIYFPEHTEKYSTCYLRFVWPMKLIHGNQHSQHPKEYKKQPGTWKRDRSSQKIQSSKARKIDLQNVCGKRKAKVFTRINWLINDVKIVVGNAP